MVELLRVGPDVRESEALALSDPETGLYPKKRTGLTFALSEVAYFARMGRSMSVPVHGGVRRRRVAGLIAAAASVCLTLGVLRADPVLGIHTWETSDHGWTDDSSFVTLERQTSGGDPGGWLKATFAETTAPEGGDGWYATLSTKASDLFAGGWNRQQTVAFDFWETGLEPTVQVRWKSATDSYIWAQTVDIGAVDGWRSLSASLLDWTDWDTLSPIGASEERYLGNLATIDWVGVYVWRSGGAEQYYGLDDFRLVVPEPAETLLLGAAMAASVFSVRRKRGWRKAVVGRLGV
jgi:hypothetical protein